MSLDQHAHTLRHLESRLPISPDNLCLYNLHNFKEDVEYYSGESSYKSPTAVLFDVDTERISIRVGFQKFLQLISFDLSRLATTLNRLERSIQWDQKVEKMNIMMIIYHHQLHLHNKPLTLCQLLKLPILKKGEYGIWAMKMEHYLKHIDYPIWEVIQKGNGPVQVLTDTNGQIKVLPPKTAEEILAREREKKARTTLLMAIPEDHLAKFHKMTDAEEMYEAIKSRFGGNDESKKMQKYILKQQFESFSVSPLKMPIKSFLGLYLLPGPNTNDVSTAYGFSTSFGYNSQKEGSSSYTDELKYSFFANQSSGPQLDHEDLEQVDEFDLEEIDLKWQVAMISMRLEKFYKKIGRRLQFDAKEPVGFDKTKVGCFNCHNTGQFTRECRSKGNQESRRRYAGNTGYKAKDKGRRPEDEQENFALMAYSNSGLDTEVTSCSKECVESYAKLEKLYDEQREQLGDASIEIQAYTQALKKVEAQLVAHQKNQLWYEENIRFMKINWDDKTNVLTYHKKLLAEAVKEKEELKTKLKNFQNSSKDLSKLLNSQMSTRDKSGLGYGNQIHEGVLSYEKKFLKVCLTYESDSDDEYVIEPLKEQEKPSFAFVNTVKHVKTPRETIKEQNTCSPSHKVNKRDWNGSMSKRLGLGYGFTKKACLVCSSFSHLIRDCDFHEKRMAKQVELNKQKGKGTGQGENRPIWKNVQRLNHQNKFLPKAVLTKTSIFSVNTARQNPFSQAAETSTTRKVNTTRPIVNKIKQRNNFYKSHSPIRRPFNKSTAPKVKFINNKVNTGMDKTISAVRGYRETVGKASWRCKLETKRHLMEQSSKSIGDPQVALKDTRIFLTVDA
ncbi:hypothetical protein Tco_0681809 [Tanacetum coccineum]|uniref:Uncharacterized protein n=1 Tax=Tanacetum coccineum TaxID=301880 RepID=A0ABQ4XPH8_9ASTR